MDHIEEKKIAIIGLGYVGLPLAIEFSKKRPVMAFDINQKRIYELKQHIDKTLEVSEEELRNAKYLYLTFNLNDIKECNIFIITVPTPIDNHKNPNLDFLNLATQMIAEAAKVIENTQRDLNIGLINEFAIIFNKLGIDTEEILQAAETKKKTALMFAIQKLLILLMSYKKCK